LVVSTNWPVGTVIIQILSVSGIVA
jgi:hypothetical protein